MVWQNFSSKTFYAFALVPISCSISKPEDARFEREALV